METRQGSGLISARLLKIRVGVLTALAALFAACGGGSDGGGGGGNTNNAPTANAGTDQSVAELVVVQLAGSGTDPDAGDTLSFAWTQTAGSTVTLNTPTSASTSFTAPDVPIGTPEVLTFQLTVTDSGGASNSDVVSISVQEPGATVTISGDLTYEFPPPQLACAGLQFNNVQIRPIRRATVQLLDATATNVLATTVSDDNGAYSFVANASTSVVVRVRAELKQAGTPSWDVEVRNNVVDPADPNPPALNQRPIYVLDSTVFDSGVTDQNVDLLATTGWVGPNNTGSFANARAAAPFSVLDAVYSSIALIVAEDATANFPALDAYWSPDNVSTRGPGTFAERVDSGEIGTSFYTGDQLFLLGRDGDDVEEFDDHVIVHEWGHYFEDNFSRSDSIGGAHGIGDILDKRVAFGEGWATALSGIALDNPQYCDTLWSGGVLTGFEIDIEDGNPGTRGWFNELSVTQLIYDLWDLNDDAADNSSIGFTPIYNVMTGAQAITPAFTSMFSFATALKLEGTGQDAFIDALLNDHAISPAGLDPFGSNAVNDGPGNPEDVLPLYTDLILGVPTRICANAQFDDGASRTGNKLSEHRYLRLTLPALQSINFSMITDAPPSTPPAGFDCTADADDPENKMHSDPDFFVYQNGVLRVVGGGADCNSEVSNNNVLAAGDYVIGVREFRHSDDDSPQNFPDQICFDFTAGP